MNHTDKSICRYFNTFGGCWFGDSCKFLHIPDKRPPCKFMCDRSSPGCKFGESCHFSHFVGDEISMQNSGIVMQCTQHPKENAIQSVKLGSNNNNITQRPKGLKISDPLTNCAIDLQAIENKMENESASKLPAEIPEEVCLNITNEDLKIDGAEFEIDMNTFTISEEYQISDRNLNLTEIQTVCGCCKNILERKNNESYCNLLKDHYLERFLEKEGEHVKSVKMKAALDAGQMYWCKSCILIFEKPWSLFQHMADKAKGTKVQRWEKKVHLDWIDSVAGLMAGHDLGLFSPAKLRTDLQNLLTDQHTVEEEIEAAAVAAATMVQWLTPMSNPWRIHQRDLMRKIENLHRQMLRRCGGAVALARSAMNNGIPGQNLNFLCNYPHITGSRTPMSLSRHAHINRSISRFSNGNTDMLCEGTSRLTIKDAEPEIDKDACEIEEAGQPEQLDANDEQTAGDGLILETKIETESGKEHVACASGDHPPDVVPQSHKVYAEKCSMKSSEGIESNISVNMNFDSNNTNSAPTYARESNQCRFNSRIRGDYSRGSRRPNYLTRPRNFSMAFRNFDHFQRPSNWKSNSFLNPAKSMPSFSSQLHHNMNHGFTDSEVEELLEQGIKPWDSEASAALAVLHGEMDHLLN